MRALIIPEPKKVRWLEGRFPVSKSSRIFLAPQSGSDDLFAASLLQREIEDACGRRPLLDKLSNSREGYPGSIAFEYGDFKKLGSEGYRLSVHTDSIRLRANDPRGIFYGVQTLRQLFRQFGMKLPCLEVEDYPDFPFRGVYHDVCRGKVPTLETLLGLVERLSFYKINQFSLYIEHTFSFKNHPRIGRGDSPLTPEDILRLDEHCRRHHIDLVPSLQSFGHMHHILKLKEYKHLAESDFRGGWTLSPVEPGTYKLLDDLYREFLPLFSSEYFNICSDETYDLGRGKSRRLAERVGLGHLYLRHILKVRDIVEKYGKRVMFWGDIVLKHPEVIPEIPRDMILLNWGYAADHNYETSKLFRDAELSQYVCPGTSTWLSLFARIDNAMANIREFARAGRKYGAIGLLNTDWGDRGHTNLLGYSWHGFLYGAECAWAISNSDPEDFDDRFSLQSFGDKTGKIGRAVRALGRAYLDCGIPLRNRSANFHILYEHPVEGEIVSRAKASNMRKMIGSARNTLKTLESFREKSDENRDTIDEMIFAARQIIHAGEKAILGTRLRGKRIEEIPREEREELSSEVRRLGEDLRNLKENFAKLWFMRNRKSNLDDNLKRYDKAIGYYDEILSALGKVSN